MSTGLVAPIPVMQFTDDDNVPLAGAKYYTWLSGTTTPTLAYTDAELSVAHPWPAIADSAGRLTVFLDRAVGYKIELRDADDVSVWGPVDDVILPPDIAPAVANSVPTGAILPYAGATAPTGFLLCQGQTVSRTTYAALYAVVGTIYNTGGEAGTDFRLPDLRGRYPIGKAAAGTADTLGSTFGLIDHVHSGPSHSHTGTTDEATGAITLGHESVDSIASEPVSVVSTVSLAAHDHDFTTDSDGTSDTGTANPPSLVLSFIVKS